MVSNNKCYPKGHFFGLGIAIGFPIGIPVSLALDNIAFGPAIGALIGLVFGSYLERFKNPHPRPLTDRERKIRQTNILILFLLGLVILALVLSAYYFL